MSSGCRKKCRVYSCVDAAMKYTLQRPFEGEEVRRALFEMGPSKALGPDGFHALFLSKVFGHCRACGDCVLSLDS